jgi:8-oxo-dGTP diphosphatase
MNDTKQVSIVPVAVIVEDGRILLTQRMPNATFPFTWECPGGKIEKGETPEQALAREIEEELGLEPVRIGDILAETPATAPGMSGEFIVRYYAVFLDEVETAEYPEMRAAVGIGYFGPYELGHLNVTPSLLIEREKIAKYMRENSNL